jgi:Arc/MetJ-type ribon-helix-helix transcriptional regulator
MVLNRVTIRVPDEVLAKARRAVETGRAASVSAYFVRLAVREPDWATAQRVIGEMIAEIGGIDPETEAWVTAVLGEDEDDVAAGTE